MQNTLKLLYFLSNWFSFLTDFLELPIGSPLSVTTITIMITINTISLVEIVCQHLFNTMLMYDMYLSWAKYLKSEKEFDITFEHNNELLVKNSILRSKNKKITKLNQKLIIQNDRIMEENANLITLCIPNSSRELEYIHNTIYGSTSSNVASNYALVLRKPRIEAPPPKKKLPIVGPSLVERIIWFLKLSLNLALQLVILPAVAFYFIPSVSIAGWVYMMPINIYKELFKAYTNQLYTYKDTSDKADEEFYEYFSEKKCENQTLILENKDLMLENAGLNVTNNELNEKKVKLQKENDLLKKLFSRSENSHTVESNVESNKYSPRSPNFTRDTTIILSGKFGNSSPVERGRQPTESELEQGLHTCRSNNSLQM